MKVILGLVILLVIFVTTLIIAALTDYKDEIWENVEFDDER